MLSKWTIGQQTTDSHLELLYNITQFLSIANSNKPPRPEVLNAASASCGKSIEVKWNSREFGYEIKLKSSSNTTVQHFRTDINYPTTKKSHTFLGLTIDTAYEVWLRDINSHMDGLWAKTLLRTSAGISLNLVICLMYSLHIH